MKELIYVDAENVSRSVVIDEIKKIKNSCRHDDEVVGKFYGAQGTVATSIKPYLSEGMEYVETSSIAANRKNIVDMKISVDCVLDVFVQFRNEVRDVWIFTSDYDFIPLIYKLAITDVTVHVPFFNADMLPKTVGDIENALIDSCYRPMCSEAWMLPQYGAIIDELGAGVWEHAVRKYCTKKQRRFLEELSDIITDRELSKLHVLDITEFSIISIFKTLDISADDARAVNIVNLYTRKFFGRSFSSRKIPSMKSTLSSVLS